MSNEELSRFMVEKAGLGLSNGYAFGRSLSGYMRLNAICPRSVLKQALEQLRAAVSLLAPDSICHMVTTVVGNFTGFFALGTVFTIMIGVGVADGTGFMSALLRKVYPAGGVQTF